MNPRGAEFVLLCNLAQGHSLPVEFEHFCNPLAAKLFNFIIEAI